MDNAASLRVGGEAVPFTMQAEIGHMSLDEAIASGLFDLPDEPGMVRIPVSLTVAIPHDMLHPPVPPPEPVPARAPARAPNGVPTGGGGRTRFGNYPKAIAAQNVARSFQSPADAQAERDDFRALLGVLHPRRGPRAPDGTPIQRAADEPEESRDADGSERSPLEAARLATYGRALRALQALEPDYADHTPPGWVPDEAAVAKIEARLRAAEARAAAAAGDAESPELPLLVVPAPSSGATLNGTTLSGTTLGDTTMGGLEIPRADKVEVTHGTFPILSGSPSAAEATRPASARAPGATASGPPMRLAHIIDGDINAAGKAGGFHLRPGGKDPATARMTRLRDKPDRFGVYTGFVEIKDPVTGRFIAKRSFSSFFPDSFTKQQVVEAIRTAFRNSGLKEDGMFTGDSGFGFQVEGFYSKREGIKTAYPVRKAD